MDQQKRFILAMVLSAFVLLGWQYFFAPPPPAPDTAQQTTSADGNGSSSTTVTDATTTAGTQAAPADPAQPATVHAPQDVVLKTSKFSVSLSNKGGLLTSLKLIDPEQYQAAGDLIEGFDKASWQQPFGLRFDKGAIKIADKVTWEVAESSATHVLFRYTGPTFKIEKRFGVNATHPYSLDFRVDVTNTGQTPLNERMILDITGYKSEDDDSSFLDFRPDELEGICRLEGDTERNLFGQLDEPQQYDGVIKWGAVNTRYFLWGALPSRQPTSCRMSKSGQILTTSLTFKDFSVAPNTTYSFENMIYAGPKDLDVLKAVGSDLSESVDYGILTVLASPLRWALNNIQKFVINWGVAIILLTLIIKLLTWPLTEKSYANAERMKQIQPQLEAIRKTHENDQQRLAEETMKLFKENSFNPFGGCLPMVLQMPILYGLYVMIVNSVELYHADFIFWYTDLSARDPYFVLPVIMGGFMLLQQKFMSTATPNAQTQVMMRLMPVIFTAFMLFLPAGLVLYYCINLILGVLQQWLIKRKFEKKANQPTVVD